MKKARSDSKLKLLSPERQEQIIAWANAPKSETGMGGLDYARKQLAADGIKVALRPCGKCEEGRMSWIKRDLARDQALTMPTLFRAPEGCC